MVIKVLVWILNLVYPYEIPLGLAEFDSTLYIFDHNSDKDRRYGIVNFLIDFPKTSIIVFLAICATAVALALFVQFLSTRTTFVGRLLYGSLAPLLSRRNVPVLTCFVLTKIGHENRRLMYAGFPTEISLREGNNIDHIIIQNPEKFYLKLNRQSPSTNFLTAKPISNHQFSESVIFVSGTEIENVHFEGFYFPYSDASLSHAS